MIGAWSQYGYGPNPTPHYGDMVVFLPLHTNLLYTPIPEQICHDVIIGIYRGGCVSTQIGPQTVGYGCWWTTLPAASARVQPH